ncbi:MAG: adenylate/guanylate cyclase domain-containing protein [Gammaproteobacteria bacterium]|nr:adenylate/guanylate cyclase domain-containing protein [Gammaproteobacteria bacterium]
MGKDIELAILFADVVGSTSLYELMGELKARDTVAHCIEVMKDATEKQNGTVIKTMGDEVMATFPTADCALGAACEMQQTISSDPSLSAGDNPVSIRIGCHFGAVVLENRDVFGSAVHTANRMTSQAKAKQIITTSPMVERLSEDWRSAVRQIDVATVRGRSDEVAVYEVVWQPDEATSMLPTIQWDATRGSVGRLSLRFHGREVVVDETHPQVSMGRAEDNDLVIKGNLISRLHARIEVNRNKFLLVDQSTNGTFVQTRRGEELFVRRDSMQLSGEGVIGLGRLEQPGSNLAIHFNLEG